MAWIEFHKFHRMNQLIRQSKEAGVYCRFLLRGFQQLSTRPVSTTVCKSKDSEPTTEDMEKLKNNPYFSKYASKLQEMQKNSPDEFQTKLEDMEKKKKVQNRVNLGSNIGTTKKETTSNKPQAIHKASDQTNPLNQRKEKTLDTIMKTELLKDKTVEEITEIWKKYHVTKDSVYAVISGKDYDIINNRTQKYPLFVYPIPRDDGYEFMLGQFAGHECYFTTLINYQTHQENAPFCLNLTHYPDLKEEKGLVLMVGEYDSNVINIQNAQMLAQQVQLFYGPSSSRFYLVEAFNKNPEHFQYTDIVSSLEDISFGK